MVDSDKWDVKVQFFVTGKMKRKLQRLANKENKEFKDGFQHSADTMARKLMFIGQRAYEGKK